MATEPRVAAAQDGRELAGDTATQARFSSRGSRRVAIGSVASVRRVRKWLQILRSGVSLFPQP